MTTTYSREAYDRDVTDARDSFRIVAHLGQGEEVQYIEAEADTGTRYALAVALLPDGAQRFAGAPFLVSVTSPWQINYPLQALGDLHIGYVAEKFVPRGVMGNGGDVAALTLAIAHALGREAVLS
jgi:hypothetical protein